MKINFTPPCTKCGKRKRIGNTNGLPNMLGFVLDDGRTINICQDCMCKLGTMSNDDKKRFFDELNC